LVSVDTLRGVNGEEAAQTTIELPSDPRRHFVVCGDNPMAFRLIEELITQYEGFVVAIVQDTTTAWVDRMRRLTDVEIVVADRLDADAFRAARLDHAEALALVDQEDAANVEAALLAQELNPRLRIVIRMFKISLGERISTLLNNCVVLSAAAIAAPAFVAAALDAGTPPITLGDRTVVGIRRDRTRPEDMVAGLAVLGERGTTPEVLAADADERADFVLARAKPAAPARPPKPPSSLRFLPIIFGPRLRLVLAVFLVLFLLGTAALALAQDIPWTEAAYSALITELTGNAAPEVDGFGRVAVVLLVVVSIGLIPALTATIVDALVKARLQREAGGLYEPISDHIVVVGLGDVGTRISRALYDQGVSVVAIERNPEGRGVQVARDLHIPVIIGDASRSESLTAASVGTCRALIVASTDDVTNLETALLGRGIKPDLRVVLRLFDGEFADRVRQAFNINISRSVSYLAGPAFAAALIGRQVLATIPVRRRVLLVAEVPVGEGSAMEHKSVGTLNRPHESRLLAIRTTDQFLWRPSDGRPLRSTDRLIVIATRSGLSHLLTDTTAQATAEEPAPFRLLEPWEIPHSRSGSGHTVTEGIGAHPPFRPADGGSTGPA
jgi:Trk K+ transport system NAD-binding subunit